MTLVRTSAADNCEYVMIKLWAICRNTFMQTIRQPIYGVLILVTFAVLVLDLPLAGWTMGSEYHETDQKMLVNLGLSTLMMSGLFISAFSASSVLSREIEDKTALTVIAKPVSRGLFVLGKFGGVAAAVSVALYLCSLVFLMTVRHKVMPAASDPYDWPVIVIGLTAIGLTLVTALGGNFMFGWTFTSAGVWSAMLVLTIAMGTIAIVGKGWKIIPFGEGISPQILLALVQIFMVVMIFAAVAVAASTRLGQVLTLLTCFAVFVLGSMHPYLFGRWAETVVAARLLGWAAPKLTYFDQLDALTRDIKIPVGFVLLSGAYCAVYIAAILAVGMAMFQRKQLEAQTSSSTLPAPAVLLAFAGVLCAVFTGIAALFAVSLSSNQTAVGLAADVGILAAAIATCMLWIYFSRGARWSWWVVLCLTLAVLATGIVAMLVPAVAAYLPGKERFLLPPVAVIVAAAVMLVLVLPKTRRHFTSV